MEEIEPKILYWIDGVEQPALSFDEWITAILSEEVQKERSRYRFDDTEYCKFIFRPNNLDRNAMKEFVINFFFPDLS